MYTQHMYYFISITANCSQQYLSLIITLFVRKRLAYVIKVKYISTKKKTNNRRLNDK